MGNRWEDILPTMDSRKGNVIKLPFKSDSPAPERLELAESEEVKGLKEEMEKMKLKKCQIN